MSVRVFERLKKIIASELFDDVTSDNESLRTVSLDREIQDLKLDLGRLIAERYQIEKTFSTAQSDLNDLDEKASKALELDREDLARAALIKKADLRAKRERALVERDELTSKIDTLERILQVLSEPDRADSKLKDQLLELDRLLAQVERPSKKDG